MAGICDILPDIIVCAKPDAYLRRITGQAGDRDTELAACRKNAVDIRMFRILYGKSEHAATGTASVSEKTV